MKLAGITLLLAFGTLGTQAFAQGSDATVVETYTYDSTLDIAKVIAVSDIADECGPVPAQMTYEDSHGQRHILQYQVMGSGCSNG
ncbi:DUF2790 domain-containing protein [Pseudomonas vancouverensis]|uniref:DUF2790 domain-containing protein n=1 Tax=Pseudomonas vancouverensis TaxID=95300 RepID=A0A1H2NRE2_PSEVA|nr:DUF2790 domain-containing protein [Pseudomonas vancouverensis]KAB0491168.1 DUF2790 domain-containing protein [Pseudomonas vancouverensis]TDB59620.1 DUF2790 domain-containing protein [Pseudomonas vancouverensis]SDV08067.1 Protein of unknown function [Pseudomonas vancouverensis]